MKWEDRRRSDNVEDRRGSKVSAKAGGSIGVIIIVLIGLYFGYDLTPLLDQGQMEPQTKTVPYQGSKEEENLKQFVSVVLADTEDTWKRIFSASGSRYKEPVLVLFRGGVKSACGTQSSAVGPFYCPGDSKVYIDLGFYEELKNRFKAPGDTAQAYVIAHEVGHHIQNLTGISGQVHQQQQRLSKKEANKLSVKLELQADCYAGIWAHHANKKAIMERGDIDEALNAASKIGDDNIQRQTQGRVVPDSFTHGSSEQRMYWFKKGYEMGSIEACNTFKYMN